MKGLKKLLALVLMVAMVSVLVLAMPAAYAEGGISATVTDGDGTVSLAISLNGDYNIAGIRFVVTPPEGFTYERVSRYAGFSILSNNEKTEFYIDNSEAEGIDVPAGAAVLTVVYTYDTLTACDYTFSIEVTEAADYNFEPLDIQGATTTATLVKHDWGTPSYSWSADNKTVTATRTCTKDASHVESETVNTTSEVTKEATCEEKGVTTYTATFENEAFETQTKAVADIDALGHTPGEVVIENEVAATCEENGSYDEVIYCTVCNKELSRETKTVPALGHDWNTPTYTWTETDTGYTVAANAACKRDAAHTETETVTASYQVITPATYDDEGLGRYTATFTKAPFTAQTKDIVLPKLGYKIKVTDYTNGKAGTSIDQTKDYNGTVTFTVTSDAYDHAVVVFVKSDDTYTRLTCTTESGVHSFSVEVKAATEIVIAFKGDVNLDGELKALDGTIIKRISLKTFTPPAELNRLVGDLNGDGNIDSLEGTQVSRTALNTYKIPW